MSKGKIIDSMAMERADLKIDNGYIAISMNWSEVKDCEIHYEDNTLMQTLFVWAIKGDKIIHGYTINYDIDMSEEESRDLEGELNRSFDDFLDGFLNEGDEEN